MAQEPRFALQQFIAALERHHEAVSMRRSDDDPSVQAAYEVLRNTFLDYEESLEASYGEWLPFEEADDGE